MNLFDFSALPTHLRRALYLGMVFIATVAAVAFVSSFQNQADWAAKNGVELTWSIPVMVDIGLLAAELALVVCAGVSYSRFIPMCGVLALSAASIAFNIKHADPGFWPAVAAAVPPVITIGVSVMIATLIKAVAQGLGKPLSYTHGGPAPTVGVIGATPGAVMLDPAGSGQTGYIGQRPYVVAERVPNVPEIGHPGMASPADLGRIAAARAVPEIGRSGQSAVGDGAKREAIESYLAARANAGTLDESLTASEVREALAEVGVSVTDRYVQPLLKQAKENTQRGSNGTARNRRSAGT